MHAVAPLCIRCNQLTQGASESDHALSQHGIGNLDEAGDIGALDVVDPAVFLAIVHAGMMNILHDAILTRANTLVVPGGKMGLAMQMIFTPMILRLMDRKRRA